MGGSWGLFGASRSTKEGLEIRLGILLGLVCSFLAAKDGFGSVLGLSLARFGCSREPFGMGGGRLRQADIDRQNCFPSFDTLFYIVFVLVVVLSLRLLVLVLVLVTPLLVRVRVLVLDLALLLALVLVLALVLALVLVVVVSLLPCNFSSIRLGGMRGAIE